MVVLTFLNFTRYNLSVNDSIVEENLDLENS